MMRKLGERNYLLISMAVKSAGTFDPDEVMPYFEEHLYVSEAEEVREFLAWVHKNNKPFGRANYEERFAEFKASRASNKRMRKLRRGEYYYVEVAGRRLRVDHGYRVDRDYERVIFPNGDHLDVRREDLKIGRT
jgi:hypothetical protein